MEKLIDALINFATQVLTRFRFRNRIDIARDALKDDVLKGGARWLVEDELERLLVHQSTGLSANDAIREKVAELVQKSDGRLEGDLCARAKHRLQKRDGKLLAVVEPGDALVRKVAAAAFFAMVLIGMAVMLLPALLPGVGKAAGLFYILWGLALDILAVFWLTQFHYISAAETLAPILEQLQRE